MIMSTMFDDLVDEYGTVSLLSMSIHSNGFSYCNNITEGSLKDKVLAVSYEGEDTPFTDGKFYGLTLPMNKFIDTYGYSNRARTIRITDVMTEIVYRDIKNFSIIKFDDGEVLGVCYKVYGNDLLYVTMNGCIRSSLITDIFMDREWEITNEFDCVLEIIGFLQTQSEIKQGDIMEPLKEYIVIETTDSIVAILSIEDEHIIGFSYDKKTHIDSTCKIDMGGEYTIIAETNSIIEVTQAYSDYIKSL